MNFKKILSGALCVTLISASSAVFADFSDIKGHWAESYVNAMVAKNYIKGYDDGTFKPDKTISNTEALILLSRMLGVENPDYSDSVKIASDKYLSALSSYNTEYGKEITFLLHRGVIKESDLNTYIGNNSKNAPLLRYQCAILLTKLLGAEKEIEGSVFVSSSYADTASIPSEARPYVEYVREAGIMQGMGTDSYGDPIFGPNEAVTRGQMAKMLSSLIDVLSISTARGTLSAYDDFNDTVTVGGKAYSIEKDTKTYLASYSSFKDAIGATAFVTIVRNKVAMIEVVGSNPVSSENYGIIVSATSSAGTKTLVISDAEDTSNRTTYSVNDDTKIIIKKASDTFGKLAKGDYVKVTSKSGIASQIEIVDKNSSVTATISSVNINAANPSVTVSDAKGNKTTYLCSLDGVTVTKNDRTSTLSDLVAGDGVVLKLVYNKVTKINASSKSQSLSGKISEVIHSESGSSLKISVDGKEKEYSIATKASITVDGSDGTVYDLRPGSQIEFTAESSSITKIKTSGTAAKNTVTGTVTSVQASYNMLFVNDGTSDVTIVTTNSTNIIKSSSGAAINLKSIEKGANVTITGSNATGVFVATVIIVQ